MSRHDHSRYEGVGVGVVVVISVVDVVAVVLLCFFCRTKKNGSPKRYGNVNIRPHKSDVVLEVNAPIHLLVFYEKTAASFLGFLLSGACFLSPHDVSVPTLQYECSSITYGVCVPLSFMDVLCVHIRDCDLCAYPRIYTHATAAATILYYCAQLFNRVGSPENKKSQIENSERTLFTY